MNDNKDLTDFSVISIFKLFLNFWQSFLLLETVEK